MNNKNIDFILEKYGDWFLEKDRVDYNVYHDQDEKAVKKPVFYVRFYPLFASLNLPSTIHSVFPPTSNIFIPNIEEQIEDYIINVCYLALK